MQEQTFGCLRSIAATLPLMLVMVGPIAAADPEYQVPRPAAERRAAADDVSRAL